MAGEVLDRDKRQLFARIGWDGALRARGVRGGMREPDREFHATVSMTVVRMAMIDIGVAHARGRTCAALLACLACALTVLVMLVPAAASAAGTTTHTGLGIGVSIPPRPV